MNRMKNRSRSTSLVRLVLCLAVVAVVSGCGKGKKQNEVSGKVVLIKKDGTRQDVTGGKIRFYPESGDPYPGEISPDGTFSFAGVPTGKMKVTIETESIKKPPGYGMSTKMAKPPKDVAGSMEKPNLEMSGMPVYVKIPSKYSKREMSGLTCEISEGKNEPLTFELTE